MPHPLDPDRPRTWKSRLAEGLVMALTMFLLRVLFVALHLFRPEPWWASLVAAVLFGVFWIVVALLWDVIRTRSRARR